MGADGYVSKPFNPLVLLATLQAVLAGPIGSAARATSDLVAGSLWIDLVSQRAWLHGQPLSLTRAEWTLLAALADANGRVLSQRALLARIWGPGADDRAEPQGPGQPAAGQGRRRPGRPGPGRDRARAGVPPGHGPPRPWAG